MKLGKALLTGLAALLIQISPLQAGPVMVEHIKGPKEYCEELNGSFPTKIVVENALLQNRSTYSCQQGKILSILEESSRRDDIDSVIYQYEDGTIANLEECNPNCKVLRAPSCNLSLYTKMTEFSYNPENLLIKEVADSNYQDHEGEKKETLITDYEYNSRQQLRRSCLGSKSRIYSCIEYTYDQQGRKIAERKYFIDEFTGKKSDFFKDYYEYDQLDHITKRVLAMADYQDDIVIKHFYDAESREIKVTTDSLNRRNKKPSEKQIVHEYQWDTNQYFTTKTSTSFVLGEAPLITFRTYDLEGFLLQEVGFDSKAPEESQLKSGVTYSYVRDDLGRITKITEKINNELFSVTMFEY